MRVLHLFAALFILIGTFVLTGETSQACGCIPAKTEAELAPYKAKAERGDAEAAGTVWFEYEYNGAPASPQRIRYWRSKAIRLADPHAIQTMAEDWLQETQYSISPEHKRLFANTAVTLLIQAWQSRDQLKRADQNNGWDEQLWYARQLRTAVGVRAVLRDGVTHWQTRANDGDAAAAHHLAVYYYYGTYNHERRTYWERRAAVLGDPDFASDHGPVQIRRALQPGAPVYRIPDRWTRTVLLRKLNAQIGRRPES